MPDIMVSCCICGEDWPAASPGVEYRSLDRRWWCRDETRCTDRRARRDALAEARMRRDVAEMEAMQGALQAVWVNIDDFFDRRDQ